MSLEIGQILGGQYLIERLIGQGSMGSVYQGRDTTSAQPVAVRLIRPEFDSESVSAFIENDAKVVGQLGDEHIARLINMGFLPSGERCIVSEYVEGELLQHRMRRLGRMSERAVAQLLVQLLESLSRAHEAGVVHRDLTPLSIFIVKGPDGCGDTVKLIDFGISRLQLLMANPESPAEAIIAEIESLQYLSPEQLNGPREPDPRSNIYTLGVIAYEAITGRLPFEGKDFSDLTLSVLRNDPTPVEDLAPQSSSTFAQLVAKAMARSPNSRFQYAEEMYAAISNWATRSGIAKSDLEAGITDESERKLEQPALSDTSSVVALLAERDGDSRRPPPATDNETLPWSPAVTVGSSQAATAVSTLGSEASQSQGVARAEPDVAALDANSAQPATLDPFQLPPVQVRLAEEDALFGPPPTPPRDELPFVALEELSTSAPSSSRQQPEREVAPMVPAVTTESPSQGVTSTVPAVTAESPSQGVTSTVPAVTAEPPSQEGVTSRDAGVATTVDDEVARVVPSMPVLATPGPAEAEQAAGPASEVSVRMSKTILGIGGIVAGAPQFAEPGFQPGAVNRDVEPTSHRPRQATEPGISPIPPVEAAVASSPGAAQPMSGQLAPAPSSMAALSELANRPAVAASLAEAAEPVPVVQPAVVAQPAVAPQPAATAQPIVAKPALLAQPAAAAQPVALRTAIDEAAMATDASRLRSRKPLVIAILLIGLAAAGVAVALLQDKSAERNRVVPEPVPSVAAPIPSQPVSSPIPSQPAPSAAPVASSAPEPQTKPVASAPADSATKSSTANRKPAPTLSQSMASSVDGARAASQPQPKTQNPARPVQGSQASGTSATPKPNYSKPAAGKGSVQLPVNHD